MEEAMSASLPIVYDYADIAARLRLIDTKAVQAVKKNLVYEPVQSTLPMAYFPVPMGATRVWIGGVVYSIPEGTSQVRSPSPPIFMSH